MLKTEAMDGVTVGEVVEAEEGAEGEHLRRRVSSCFAKRPCRGHGVGVYLAAARATA